MILVINSTRSSEGPARRFQANAVHREGCRRNSHPGTQCCLPGRLPGKAGGGCFTLGNCWGDHMSKPESYASVWDVIADTPEQAANLRSRAELMQAIAARLKQHGWTQAEAATHCGVTQPRINDLLRGRVSRFSLDALVNIATALGCRVRFDLEAA